MPAFSDHAVHAIVHEIHRTMGYVDPPFSISRVMETMFPEVAVVGRDLEEQHATIEVYGEPLPSGHVALIAYREQAHHSTHRFSIAHELGHWIFCLDCGRDLAVHLEPCGGDSLCERRADYFAAELLCPLWLLHDYVDFKIFPGRDEDAIAERDQRVQRLASRFNLSLACLKRRVIDLHAWRKISR